VGFRTHSTRVDHLLPTTHHPDPGRVAVQACPTPPVNTVNDFSLLSLQGFTPLEKWLLLSVLSVDSSIVEFVENAIELFGNPTEHLKESGIEMTG
jgi:hypothetical protein